MRGPTCRVRASDTVDLQVGIVPVSPSSFKLVNVGTVFELAVDGAEFGVGSLMMWLMPKSVALLMVLLTLRSNS